MGLCCSNISSNGLQIYLQKLRPGKSRNQSWRLDCIFLPEGWKELYNPATLLSGLYSNPNQNLMPIIDSPLDAGGPCIAPPGSEFQTPPHVCDYMASLVPAAAQRLLEPTPGDGNLVAALRKLERQKLSIACDFFLIPCDERFDCIVMNPPFSSKSGFLQKAPPDIDLKGMKLGYYILNRCLEMSDSVIALMPWYTLTDSDVRMRRLQEYGIKSITALPRKTFQYSRIQTLILEMRKGWKGKTSFDTFDF